MAYSPHEQDFEKEEGLDEPVWLEQGIQQVHVCAFWELIAKLTTIQRSSDIVISVMGALNHAGQNCQLRIFIAFHGDLLQ